MIIILYIATLLAVNTKGQGFVDLSSASQCTNPIGKRGTCINIYGCDILKNLLLAEKNDKEVVAFIANSQCGWEGSNPKVCCPFNANDVISKANLPDNSGFPRLGVCGKSSAQHTRIVGGNNATLGAWPWMAAFGYRSNKGGSDPVFLCAGSLITDRHVLTAAHCILTSNKLLFVRLGDLNLYDDRDRAEPVDVGIARTIVHEAYSKTSFTNDIAIIELAQPVTFTDNIKPVCLPLSRELRAKSYVGRSTFIAGWGSLYYRGPNPTTLQELQIPVIATEECKRAYARFKSAVIDKRILCAGYVAGGKDSCEGDSGGPLVDFNNQDKAFYQIGIVSYGFKCAEAGFPGVYARVTEFADWIIDKVESKNS